MRKALLDYRHVVWDWNGTLLDDTWLCCAALNHLLAQDGHPTVDPVYYRQIFQFPVINVYQAIGFTPDEHSFNAMSVRFMHQYEIRKQECALHPGSQFPRSRSYRGAPWATGWSANTQPVCTESRRTFSI